MKKRTTQGRWRMASAALLQVSMFDSGGTLLSALHPGVPATIPCTYENSLVSTRSDINFEVQH